MKLIRTWLNEKEFQQFSDQCEKLNESSYQFVKTAVKERMAKNQSLIKKIDKWLFEKDLKL